MAELAQPVVIARGEGWEMARHLPPPPLAPHVESCTGYRERTDAPLARRESPGARVVMIVELGPPMLVDGARPDPLGFAAGLSDRYTLVEHGGAMAGIQVNFTPAGAYRFFALPMSELAQRALGLPDLLGGAGARGLVERIGEARSWAERFTILDEALLERLARGPSLTPWVAWAWRQIQDSGGQIPIATLAREVGFSRKHVAARFHEELGLPPKTLAGIVRFQRVLAALRARPGDLCDIALGAGYYDQPHFVREFRRFTGLSPGAFLRAQLPGMGGVAR